MATGFTLPYQKSHIRKPVKRTKQHQSQVEETGLERKKKTNVVVKLKISMTTCEWGPKVWTV